MTEYAFIISEEEEGERVDRHLAALLGDMSRSYLQRLLKEGAVLVADAAGAKRAVKASYGLRAGDVIHLAVPEAVGPTIGAEDIPLEILYEDEHLLVVNKPKGMVVHPAPGHYSGTLVNALLHHCHGSLSGINGVMRPGIVHRLDRDTTGALVICKNDRVHQEIARQLQEHSSERVYLAIACGVMKNDSGSVDLPLGRHPKERKKMAVLPAGDERGRRAVTHYLVRERFRQHTYLECRLETGRTHQIRVHMAQLGHPLLGDAVYGRAQPPLAGQTLHAAVLGFTHPSSGERVRVEAPLPAYFAELLHSLP
jgi:23S rRNA pseudouridine1911/1915/1917 synthase